MAADDAGVALLWNVGGGRSALTVLDLGSGGEVEVPLPASGRRRVHPAAGA